VGCPRKRGNFNKVFHSLSPVKRGDSAPRRNSLDHIGGQRRQKSFDLRYLDFISRNLTDCAGEADVADHCAEVIAGHNDIDHLMQSLGLRALVFARRLIADPFGAP
jgi:hypothetical protein